MKKPCREPNLDELLDDAAMRLLMARDGVDEAALRRLVGSLASARPAARRCGEATAPCCF